MSSQGERKGYWVPDEYLQAKRGMGILRRLTEWDAHMRNAVGNYRTFLFDYMRDEAHVKVLCEDTAATRWIAETYAQGRYWGRSSAAFNLVDWLRQAAHSLAVHGEIFYAIDFVQDDIGYVAFGEPRWLAPETMYVGRRRGKPTSFVQQYSPRAAREDVRCKRFVFGPHEVLWLRWPQALPPGREGTSPISKVVVHAKGARRFMDWLLLRSRADAYPEDKTPAVERARYERHEDQERKRDYHLASLLANMGVPQAFHRDIAMTEHFVAWELCGFGERIAVLREYLVTEFSEQVLRVWAKRNSVVDIPRLRAVGYPSPQDWRDAFCKYERNAMSLEDVRNMLRG